MTSLEPLQTLFDDTPPDPSWLSPSLEAIYQGRLSFPLRADATRPYVISNFVTSLDGVISYGIAGQDTGGNISGNSQIDHAIMGTLRACADAVIWGSASYAITKDFVPTPAAIWRPGATEFELLRQSLGKPACPLAVIITSSGDIPQDGAIIQRADQPAAIITSQQGSKRLSGLHAPNTHVHVTADADRVSPAEALHILWEAYHVRLALHEGGATLFGAFLQAGLVDELFLTIAPQLAGRDTDTHRPSLVERAAFLPATAPWANLISLKRCSSHLFSRYIVIGPR